MPGATGVGDQTQLGEGLNKFGRARGDHDVTGQGDIGAGASCHAVDRADHRFLHCSDQADQRIVVVLHRITEIRHGLTGGNGAIIEILPGAETAPVAGEQHGAHRLVAGGTGEHLAHLRVHIGGKAVEGIRAVQLEHCHALVD